MIFGAIDEKAKISHFRVHEKGLLNTASRIEYQQTKNDGCCGSVDEEVTFIDRKTGKKRVFMFGFNYGH